MKCLLVLALLLPVMLFLPSCKVVKYVDRVQIKTDSTAIHQRDSLVRTLAEHDSAHAVAVSDLSQTQIVFRDTGSTRIEYYPDGSLKVVEGYVKNLSLQLNKSKQEAMTWRHAYDSLTAFSSRDSIQTREVVRTVSVEKKVRFIPWWVFAIGLIGYGLFLFKQYKIF